MNLIKFTLINFLIVSSISAETVNIINNTDMTLNMEYPIPAYTEAHLELIKIPSPQIQQRLYRAILLDSPEEIKDAIRAGADVNEIKDGKTPLLFAFRQGKYDAIESLFDHGAKRSEEIKIDRYSNIRLAYILMTKGDYNISMDTAMSIFRTQLFSTDIQINLKFIKELFKRGYDINLLWYFIISCYCNRNALIEIIQFMIDNGANVNFCDKNVIRPPLFTAIELQLFDLIKLLVHSGADVNYKIEDKATGIMNTPLLEAMIKSRTSNMNHIINFLIDHGAQEA